MAKRISCFAALCVSAMLMFAPPASAQGLNCDDFDSQAAAQQRLWGDPSDPDGLDGPPGEGFIGIQGVACEELPQRGTSSGASYPWCWDSYYGWYYC